MSGISWKMDVGVNHVPAYQVSGRPFAKGNVDASSAVAVQFPYVTRWFQVTNRSASPIKLGFSELGIGGTNYIRVDASGSSGYGVSEVYELKVSEIWLLGGNGIDVMAGLTSILPERVSGSTGPSWSGSAGVG